MEKYDVIIIGGGAAGIMAGITVKKQHPEFSVVIIDQTFSLGRKILVSGAGRCNLTNKALLDGKWQQRYYSDTPQLLDSVFSQFGFNEIVGFFKDLGVILYEEQKNHAGKMFPIMDSAKNVVSLLVDELERLGVNVKLNHACNKVRKIDMGFEVQVQHEKSLKLLRSKYLIIAAGGKTYPALGANGSGYELAQGFGHALAEPVPAAGPLTSQDKLCHELQGVKLPVEAGIFINGKIQKQGFEDLMFTQYGVSGSLIFNLSRSASIFFNREKGKGAVILKINFLPQFKEAELIKHLEAQWMLRPGQLLCNSLLGLLNAKVAVALCKRAGCNANAQVKDVKPAGRQALIKLIQDTEIVITGTKGWNESEFTAGGIRGSELNYQTLASKMVPNLYFCGEIINVDGDVGGFNLSWAWASGHIAGKLS